MRGIAGKYNLTSQKTVSPEIIEAMCKSIVHRGPDDEGFFLIMKLVWV